VFLRDLAGALKRSGVSQQIAVLHPSDGELVEFGVATTFLTRGDPAEERYRSVVSTISLLRRVIREWKPHVIQAHGGEPMKYALVASPPSTPVVYRRIGSAHERTLHGPRRIGITLLLRRVSTIVAVAQAVREEIIRVFRVPPERVCTITNARDVRYLTPSKTRDEMRQALGIPSTATVAISMGALTWEKDPLGQLEIFQQCSARVPDAILLMAGDGPMRREVDREIHRLALADRVALLGARRDAAELLAASDVLLLASATEAMPGVLIEAGILGLPAVAYAIGGIPEVVIDETTGLLAPGGDRAAVSHLLGRLLTQGDLRHAMGRAAMERCRAVFDIHSVSPQYLNLYQQLARSS
jgi:glycosyltransferase involved in cell wall biosynthesis